MPRSRADRFPAPEPLEARIAPASLTFVDVDGDEVEVTTSKGSDAQLEAAAILMEVTAGRFQLQELQLDSAPFQGTNLTIDATAVAGGDGVANLGYLNADGLDLGRVVIDGDLGRIDAGDQNFGTGVTLLELGSLGVLGITTQQAGGNLFSTIDGSLNSVIVHGNIQDARVDINGTLEKMTLEGSLIGGPLAESGSIRAGLIKNVEISGNVMGGDGSDSGRLSGGKLMDVTIAGGLIGGIGNNSGQLGARTQISKITLGSLTGGAGIESGGIVSSGNIANVTINGDVTGGTGIQSGELASIGKISGVLITGSLLGAAGVQSGSIGSDRSLSEVQVQGNVTGSTGVSSGQIVSKGRIDDLRIDGSLIGGSHFETGAIGSLNGLDKIVIGQNIIAGTGERSGLIVCDAIKGKSIGSVEVLGSIEGAAPAGVAGADSGGILSAASINSVEVAGDLVGGPTADSGSIRARDGIKNAVIRGNVIGGDGESSGSIHSAFNVGRVLIDGDLRGGAGFGSGAVLSATTIDAVTVHGSVIGGAGDASGRIESDGDGADGDMGKIIVDGAVQGGTGLDSGLIFSSGALDSAQVGTLLGGGGRGSGSIAAAGKIGTLQINDVTGGSGDESGKIIGGSDIKRLTIAGALTGSRGDYDTTRRDIGELGQIYAGGTIDRLTITDLVGDAGNCSAQIRAAAINEITVNGSVRGGLGLGSGAIIAEESDLGSVTIVGQLASGSGAQSGQIGAARNIDSLTIGTAEGSLGVPALITAGGALLPKNNGAATAIGQLTINQSTTFTNILAGYDVDGVFFNPDAQIKRVVVGASGGTGDWSGTNLAAGVAPGDDGEFGNGDERTTPEVGPGNDLLSRIANVIINGTVAGAPGTDGERFGIVAEQVLSATVSGEEINLGSGPNNDFVSVGSDTRVIEVGAE